MGAVVQCGMHVAALLLALASRVPPGTPAPEEPPPEPPPPPPVVVDEKACAALRKPSVVSHVAVQDVEAPDGLDARARAILTAALVAEVRKIDGASVMGMDEVRALVAQESQKQAAGCEKDSCISELADALGAELVVSARVQQIGDQVAVSFRRFDNRDAAIKGVDKQVAGTVTGEEFLALLGPAVSELFPEMPLKKGAVRGVAPEQAKKLSPPPLPPWVFWTTASATGASLATGVLAGGYSQSVVTQLQQDIDNSKETGGIDGKSVQERLGTVETSALVANVSLIATAGLALTTGAMFVFTDFEGYGDAAE